MARENERPRGGPAGAKRSAGAGSFLGSGGSSEKAPELTLRLKKGPDGRVASFALERRDGSVTVQRHPQDFFAAHDLTHYAVETTLSFAQAFYGLVADGWDFGDFGAPWPRGRIPGTEAVLVEHIVGFLDLERTSGSVMTASEISVLLRERGLEFTLSENQLERVRTLRDSLIRKLQALDIGDTMQLPYSRGNLAEG